MPYIYRPRVTSAEQWKPSSTPEVSSGSVGAAPASAGFRSTGISQVARKGSVQTGIAGGAFGSLFTDPGQGLAEQGSRSQQRGLPERVDANVMSAIDTAVRTPASILERPVALLNRATGGAIANGDNGGLLGAIGNFDIGGIKPIGDLIGSVNNALAFSGNLVPAFANSGDASLLAAFGERGDDFVIPGGAKQTGGGLFGIGNHDMTVGELKKNLKDRGFLEQHNEDGTTTELTWEQLIAKIRNGGIAGGLQFGDKPISDNLIADTAYRILADPTNILLGAGVLGKTGRIGKLAVDALGTSDKIANAGKFARWTLSPATKLVTGSGLRAVRGTGYLADMAKMGLRSEAFAAPRATVEAIKQGKVAQATLKGFGLALKTPKAVFLPGKGNLAERYARGAFRMQLGGLALESTSGWVSDRLGEDPKSGFFAGIHQASQEIMEDRPLSNSSAFLFASAFGMPLLPLTREHLGTAGRKLHEALGDADKTIWAEWLGNDLSGKRAINDPTGRLRGKGKAAGLEQAFGSDEAFRRAIDHVDMKIAFDDLVRYNPVAEHFKSFDDALRSSRIGRIVAEHASEMRAQGKIKPRQRLDAFEDMARSRYHTVIDREGNIRKDVREPRDFDLTPAQMIEQWNDYSKVLDGIYSKFGEQAQGIIGRAKRFTKEDLRWLRSAVQAADEAGQTPIDPLRSMLVETAAMWNDPAVAANAERSNFWRSIMSMEGGNGQYSEKPLAGVRTPRTRTVATDELLRQIDVLEKEAPTAAELFGEAVAAEKAAPNDIPRAAGPMKGGRFRKIYSHETLRRFRTEHNSKLRQVARQVEEDKKAFEQRWTSRGNLRVRRSRQIGGKLPTAGVNEIRAEVAKFGLGPEESAAVEALMQARAEAWSHQTGAPASEWLPTHIKEIRQGGQLSGDALLQESGFLESSFENARAREARNSMHEANQARLAYQQADAAAVRDRLERNMMKTTLTDEQVASRNEALAKVFGHKRTRQLDDTVVSEMYQAVQDEWGGATYDPRSGRFIEKVDGVEGPYASGIGETRSLTFDEAADPTTFKQALDEFVAANADNLNEPNRAVGVFRDESKGTVDLDVSHIDYTHADAVATQQARGAGAGGAFDFSTGRGVWGDELRNMIDEAPPAVLEENGLGGESTIEPVTLKDGGTFYLPGGEKGLTDGSVFTPWDMWKVLAQTLDPNRLPDGMTNLLHAKIFRTHVRSLETDPLDAFNRMTFALLSPNLNLIKNDALYSAMRFRNMEDVKRLADLVDEVSARDRAVIKGEEKTLASDVGYEVVNNDALGLGFAEGSKNVTTNIQVGNIAIAAKRFLEDPDWFALRPGEDMLQYAERLSAVLPGAGFKVANFGVMLGDPIRAPKGTMDVHMAQLFGVGDKAPPAQKIPYYLADGSINPEIPAHLRDLPWPPEFRPGLPKSKQPDVIVYGGKYAEAHQALEAAMKGDNIPDFAAGGYQWLRWSEKRGILDPHPLTYPGAYRLPKMDAGARQSAFDALKRAGVTGDTGNGSPFRPSEGFLYQDAKGATSFEADGRAVIQAFESADLSTAVHELGHVYRRDLTPEHLATAEKHYGVVDGAWDTVHEEGFARDFERYVRDGKAPTKALVPVFQQLRDWMVRIYRTLKGSPLASRVSPEMRRVFDSLFKVEGSVHDLAREAVTTGDLSILPHGVPGVVEQLSRREDGITLVKYGEDGAPAGALDLALKDGKAAQNGVIERGDPQSIADLYAQADSMGLDAEQAALVSNNLTPEMKANQKARWEAQRVAEQEKITAGRERAKEIRRQIREIDKQAERLRTIRIDDRFYDDNGNVKTDPKSLENLREQQLMMADMGYTRQFNLEPAPNLSYRHRPEDSHLAALLRERSMIGTMLVDYGPLSKAFHAIDAITRPVNSSKMARDSRQMLMNKLIAMGAKPKEVTDFVNEVREAAADFTVSKGEYAIFRGQSAIPPNKINAIARKHFGENKTFMQHMEKRGGIQRTHTILDEAYNSAVRKIDTKILRGQKLNRLEQVFRSGYWAFQNVPGLRGVSDGTRMLSRTVYPMFRFIFDPRWILQNTVEADIIGFFNDGLGGTRLARTPERVVRRMGQDVNISQNALAYHAAQSGLGKYLPKFVKDDVGTRPTLTPDLANEAGVTSINHHLYPVLRRQFDINRPETIRKIIDAMPENDPVIGLLERKFGKEKGTWGQQLDEMLYSFDRRGVRRTIDEEVRRVSKYEKWSQAEFDQMQPLVSKLVERNQQAFEDLIHMHIGNVDRSRIERVMNSFWLYWPLSYQIKASKWMGHVLTDRSFAGQTNLGGAWALDRLADNFRQGVENNPGFQQQLKDNEDLWFVASMLLPIAPWDAGVSLNKLVRYTGGNVLDLWPEYAGVDNPGDYATRLLEMGPLYTVKLAQRLWSQYLSDKDKKEAA